MEQFDKTIFFFPILLDCIDPCMVYIDVVLLTFE